MDLAARLSLHQRDKENREGGVGKLHGLIVFGIIVGIAFVTWYAGLRTYGTHQVCDSAPIVGGYKQGNLRYNDQAMVLTVIGDRSYGYPVKPYFFTDTNYTEFLAKQRFEGAQFGASAVYRGDITYMTTNHAQVVYSDVLFFISRNYVFVFRCDVPNT